MKLLLPNCSFTRLSAVTTGVKEWLRRHFPADEWPKEGAAHIAVATLLHYLHDTVRTDLSHLNRLLFLDSGENLVLDANTLRNLEITRNLRDGGKKNTLLDVLDYMETAMGSRLLKKWLEYPLFSLVQINQRLEAVAELTKDFALRQDLRESCK